MTALVRTENLTKTYQDGAQLVSVLQGVNLQVAEGDMLAIVGTSGSGKSTLLHILGSLDDASEGEVWMQGQALSQLSDKQRAAWRNKHLGFIYQFHHLLAEFTALENVAMPLLIAGADNQKATDGAKAMLKHVGLEHRLGHTPAQLSGGERQRVAIARALVNNPKLVLADEPTGNLDEETAETIYQLMLTLNRQFGTAFIVVTHDQALANKLPRQLHLHSGVLDEATA